jgi:hypothetical protein
LQTNQDNTTFDYVKAIFKFVRNSVYWNRISEFGNSKAKNPGKLLHEKHMQFVRSCMYEKLLYNITNLYFKNNKCTKLKDQASDTLFIKNKFGTEMIDRNKYYKNKNGIKISNITADKGIQIALSFAIGSEADCIIIEDTLSNFFVEDASTLTEKYKNNNKFKQYLSVDKAYDTKEVKKMINDKGYHPIIAQNKRKITDDAKITHLSSLEKEHYKLRTFNEHTFSWVSQYPIISAQYEKTIESYAGLYLFVSSYITFVKIKKAEQRKKDNEIQKQKRMENEQKKKEIAIIRKKKQVEEKRILQQERHKHKLEKQIKMIETQQKIKIIKEKIQLRTQKKNTTIVKNNKKKIKNIENRMMSKIEKIMTAKNNKKHQDTAGQIEKINDDGIEQINKIKNNEQKMLGSNIITMNTDIINAEHKELETVNKLKEELKTITQKLRNKKQIKRSYIPKINDNGNKLKFIKLNRINSKSNNKMNIQPT